ncbi:hypothetical protein [Uliginosibacterium aquaticum]|uniref:C-type lysozyme inhibitor domain-containing protein n=1 Tax=Uliginosibacterium aquaticum TaxID=2731212 RepID=A0ABX2IMU4_9RHOO|nr:hypothetical protein [Uliginosibacterium aquaticum]NSL55613.1 hypothetical protein [Uliginosibacterium aquaticum]
MKNLLILLVTVVPGLALGMDSKGLCAPKERVVFSCSTNAGKQISVCSKRESVQYRFGRPGKVELEYPRNGDFTPSSFDYFHYFRPDENRTSLHFDTGDAEYTIFSESEGAKRSAGITVKVKANGRLQSLRCAGAAQANWYEIEGKVECADEPMNTCQ